MKSLCTLLLSIFAAFAVSAQYTIEDVELNGQAFKRVTGNINADETLDNASLWIIADTVNVVEQTTLTITEGTQIFAESIGTILYVNQLGQVDWQGTAEDPIVFNSLANAPGQGAGDDSPGQWIGVRIDGDGAGSNSGTIRYIRQMYAGFGDDGPNAFELRGVGSGTTLEYVQVYKNANRGFRVDGGDVNLRYMISTNSGDTGFRFDNDDDGGWTGAGQFFVVNKDIVAGTSIESRDGSAPILSNITVTGIGFNLPGNDPAGDGIRVRDDGNAQLYNAVVTGADRSVRIDNADGIANGDSFFSNSACFGNLVDEGTGFHSSTAIFNPTSGDYDPSFNNAVEPFTLVDSYVGVSTLNSTAAGALNPFFTDVNYVGAVEAGADWTEGWCFNLDGTLRELPSTVNVNNMEAPEIRIYPNPVEGNLFINTKANVSSVIIFNALGKKVYENLSFDRNGNHIDMAQFQSGMYIVKLMADDAVHTSTVIKL